MKRRHVNLTGNALMVIGLAVVVTGIGYAVLNQLPQLQLPQFLANVAIFAIFIGALMWLIGASMSGREKITDHYYWVRRYGDKRCRRVSGPGHH